MAISPNISIDKGQFDELVRVLGFKDALAASRSAVSKTLNNGKTLFRNEIAPLLNVPKAAIFGDKSKRTVKVLMVKGSAEGTITVRAVPIRAVKFKDVTPRTRYKKGVSPLVSAIFQQAKGRLTFKKSFIGKLPYTNKGSDELFFTKAVLRRGPKRDTPKVIRYRPSVRWPGRMLPVKSRNKVYQVYGPTLLNLLGIDATTAIGKKVIDGLGEKLLKNLSSQVDWIMSKKNPPQVETVTPDITA